MMAESAFDHLAASYDRSFTGSALGRRLRERIWSALGAAFPAGSRVADLGCGTGEDALWLAQRGVEVLAVDASAEMLKRARAKAEASGVGGKIKLAQVDLAGDAAHLERVFAVEASIGPLDGAYSSFGALNCLQSRRELGRVLAGRIRSGGSLILVLMGPWCAVEILAHLARGRVSAAFRRLRGGVEVRLAGAERAIRVWYPSPRRLGAELSPWFRRCTVEGLGVVLPPTYLGRRLEQRPRLLQSLDRWDRRLGRVFPGSRLADHYLVRFERR